MHNSIFWNTVIASVLSALLSVAGGLILWAWNLTSDLKVLQTEQKHTDKTLLEHKGVDEGTEQRVRDLERHVYILEGKK